MSKKIYKINHGKAWAYFVYIGKIPTDAKKHEWCLHHIDVNLKYDDPERYDEWRIEDLVPMTTKEHIRLHTKDKHLSEETRQKLSEAQKGKHLSEEQKNKVSQGLRRYWDNLWKEHPELKPKEHIYLSEDEKAKRRAEGLRRFWSDECKSEKLRNATSERFSNIERNEEWCDKISKSLQKPVLMEDINGNILKEFDSLNSAAKFLNKKSAANLSVAIKNKTIYCGYVFRYKY